MEERGFRSVRELIGSALPEPDHRLSTRCRPTKKLPQVVAALCQHCGNCTRCPYQAIDAGRTRRSGLRPRRAASAARCARRNVLPAPSRHAPAHAGGAGGAGGILNAASHDTLRCSSKTATVLTWEKPPRVLRRHSVLIEERPDHAGRAEAGRFRSFAGKRIDAAGKVVLPGLINAHTHFYSTFARGLTKTKPARDFNGRAQESLVAAGLGPDHGGLLLQRADRAPRLDPARHHDPHRSSRQPAGGRRLAGRHRAGGAGNRPARLPLLRGL